MGHPSAYDPQDGYKYQILSRNLNYGPEWEHCDYATSNEDAAYLLGEYGMAYGTGYHFKLIRLPKRFWRS